MRDELLGIIDVLFKVVTASGFIFYTALTALPGGNQRSRNVNYALMVLFLSLMIGYRIYKW